MYMDHGEGSTEKARKREKERSNREGGKAREKNVSSGVHQWGDERNGVIHVSRLAKAS